jgi:general secretion pathway protein N
MGKSKMIPFRAISFAKRLTLLWLATGFAVLNASAQGLTSHAQVGIDLSTGQHIPGPWAARSAERSMVRTGSGESQGPSNSARGSIEPLNPLWGIPLESLTHTRESPIFSPSRRPPAVAVAPRPVQPPPVVPADRPREPSFALLGAIAGEKEEIAIFLDETTKIVVRLRKGESHSGWTLRSVKGREVTLDGYQATAILSLPNSQPKP